MRAAYLIKNGPAATAFEIREAPTPVPQGLEVLIKVSGFGLNFADVMARLGFYPDRPPLPCVLGYDVAGTIEAVGPEVKDLAPGQRVMALTRFGGYAEYALADSRGVVPIPADMDDGTATALATQYGTAYYLAAEATQLFPGEHVLIHAAAGGVGTALVQWARHKKCVIYGTAGSPEKLSYLRELGVQHPINYREQDFIAVIKGLRGRERLDVIFDPIGGPNLKRGLKLLSAGGRMLAFGASSFTQANNFFQKIRLYLQTGFYHPLRLVGGSKALIGVNMLRLGDQRPYTLQRVLQSTVRYCEQGVFKPTVGGTFPIEELATAHHQLEHRQTMGKLVIKW
jgi:NADPH:quinone reductase-like Zn-dependent oxidoreductase